jgi:6-phosphofructokinase 1
MRVIGIPKTIDNDLPHTDHCPGFGSVVKYCATTVMEVGLDVGSMANDDGIVCIVEVMGRSAGWIAGGTVLARRGQDSLAPHIILFPEIQYDVDVFLAKVKEVVTRNRYCIIVVGEGIRNKEGKEIGADETLKDAFGHPVLAGAAWKLKEFIEDKLQTKTRTVLLGYAQRAAAHHASKLDVDNAAACGQAAVQAAVAGQSGYMIKITREYVEGDGGQRRVRWGTALQRLAEVANVEHFVPRDWISEDGFMANEKFVEYAAPLVEGDVHAPTEGGLPKYVVLGASEVEKKLAPRVV